jgi:EasF-like predicted methyltransferase
MRKTKYVLDAIARKKLNVTYYAVDLSEVSLRESLAPLVTAFPSIRFVGLWGTYNDSLDWIKRHLQSSRKTFLWIGSSIGNLNRQEAAQFLAHVRETAMDAGDLFICGIDRRNSFEDVSLAYNDTQKITRNFIMTGLEHCNTLLGSRAFDASKFEYVSIYNAILGRHEAYYESLEEQTVTILGKSFALAKGELINVEYSYKYSSQEVTDLLHHSKLYNVGKWTDQSGRYDLHLFQKPTFYMDKRVRSEEHYPSLDDFEQIFLAWYLS